MAIESSYTAQWLYERLNGDVTLKTALGSGARVHEQPAPQDSLFPFITFQLQSDVDVMTGDTRNRIFSDELWLIRATTDSTSFLPLKVIADRMDLLLQNADGAADGAIIYHCSREETFRLVEIDNGKQYRHLGGIYRIITQKG